MVGNDYDEVEGDIVFPHLQTPPQHGTVRLHSDGSFLYVQDTSARAGPTPSPIPSSDSGGAEGGARNLYPTTSELSARRSASSPAGSGLKGEHLAVVGLVVVAAEVQHPMDRRLDQVGRVLGADHDVAELARPGAGPAPSIGNESTSVGSS